MKKVNLTKLKIFSDYKRESFVVCNVKDTIINCLYNYIPTSSLNRSFVQRISQTDGEIEITDDEEKLILSLINTDGIITEVFRDSLLIALNQDLLNKRLKDKTNVEEVASAMRELLVEINNQ